MENKLDKIVSQIREYIGELKVNHKGSKDDMELASVVVVVDNLIKDNKRIDIKKAMVNMYYAGKMSSLKND